MKIILLLFVFLIWFGTIQAQEQSGLGPKKGTVTVSLLSGNASPNSIWLELPEAGRSSYSVGSYSYLSTNSSGSVLNMVGLEGKWFFSDKWAVRLNGGTKFNATPAHEGIPGVSLNGHTVVPTYNDVPARADADVSINMGVDRYFATKNQHLFWYASPVVNFQYARLSGFELGTPDLYSGLTGSQLSTTVGDTSSPRYAEGYGLGLSGIAGAEYYTESGIVFGFELRGISYMYSVNSILPEQGLKPLRSESHNITFLSYPSVKIGFRFK